MAENKQRIVNTHENGTIVISEDVIITIVYRALEEVDGVAGLSSPSKKNWGKSIKVIIDEENALNIECNINVVYGQSIVTIAAAVQEAVSSAISSMTGVVTQTVNINVNGVVRK